MIVNDKAIEFMGGLKEIQETGISTWAVYTHACHETGYFKRVIGRHNFWGIKKPQKWSGMTHEILTHEFEDGKNVPKIQEFADWDTISEALAFYLGLIERLYTPSWDCKECAQCFLRGLTKGKYKWATDPLYVEKLCALYGLLRQDEEIIKAFNIYV